MKTPLILIFPLLLTSNLTAFENAKPTPISPEGVNFNFFRGVVKAFDPQDGLSIVDPDGDVRAFKISEKFAVLSQSGKPLPNDTVKRGTHVTLTALDPQQADAVSFVTKVVVAEGMGEGVRRESVRGVVLKVEETEDTVIIQPDGQKTKTLPIMYRDAETQWVGGDGINVDEEQMQAGDRILVYTSVAEDSGLVARQIVFLGNSGDPVTD